MTLGEPDDKSVEKKVSASRLARRWELSRCGSNGVRRPCRIRVKSADDHRGYQSLEIGITCECRVDRAQFLSCSQQKWRCVSASPRSERDLGPHQIYSCTE